MRIPSLPGIWTLHSGLAQLIPKEQLCYRLILSCASISWFEVVSGSVIHHFQNRSSMIQHNDNQWYLTKLAGEIFLWYKWYKWYTSNTATSSDASKTSASVTQLSSYFCLCNAYWVLTGLPFLYTTGPHAFSLFQLQRVIVAVWAIEHQFLGQHLLIEIRSLSQYPWTII